MRENEIRTILTYYFTFIKVIMFTNTHICSITGEVETLKYSACMKMKILEHSVAAAENKLVFHQIFKHGVSI